MSSPRAYLSAHQALELANVYLENANNANDADISLVLCHDTEVSLSQAKKAVKRSENQAVVSGIAAAYIDLGKLLERRGHGTEAQVSFKKAEKLGYSEGLFKFVVGLIELTLDHNLTPAVLFVTFLCDKHTAGMFRTQFNHQSLLAPVAL